MQSIKTSVFACYIGYIVQAIVNNLTPLLYAMFNTSLGISTEKLALIATINFFIQILTDLGSTFFVDRIGYRNSSVIAHIFSVVGLFSLSLLPEIMTDKYVAIIIATAIMAIGGGLTEVVLSPMLQAIPLKNKEKQMTVMHSFYCWGQCSVVLLSTLFFSLIGIDKWYVLPPVWALIPFLNVFILAKVPCYELPKREDGKTEKLFNKPIFYILLLMMICSGISEIAIATWASLFAEIGLKVDKVLGDILGPCLFAVFMGVGRIFFSSINKKLPMRYSLFICSLLCFLFYMGIVFLKNSILSLLCCGLSGFCVSVMWPGTYSISAECIKNGGTRMFAFCALGGDIGCAFGAYLVGKISDMVSSGEITFLNFVFSEGRNIRAGLLVTSVFPLLMTVISVLAILYINRKKYDTEK